MKKPENLSVRFGTDGIRGIYGKELTDGTAFAVGNALGRSASGGRVIVGRDTRTSGAPLARALAEGAAAAGSDVCDLGVVTTPCVAFATRATGARFGVMISASHNPPEYNGIKIFGGDARKIPRATECAVERQLSEGQLYYADGRGAALPCNDEIERYIAAVCAAVGSLEGLKVVLDCANGAAGALAPLIFSRAGARVFPFFTAADGRVINVGCGALHPEALAAKTVEHGADIGLSFDGDADRVIACDEKGNVVDGDKILYVLARESAASDELPGNAVVGTLHTNMGVEKALGALGITLVRTDIGDHNVTARMCADGAALGGEQSGHIILGDFLPTGDGVFAGAMLASVLRKKGVPLSSLADVAIFPQRNAEVVTSHKEEIARDKGLLSFLDAVRGMLGANGRVMLRPSGTEPKLRIMTESKDASAADFAARSIELFIRTKFDI